MLASEPDSSIAMSAAALPADVHHHINAVAARAENDMVARVGTRTAAPTAHKMSVAVWCGSLMQLATIKQMAATKAMQS